MGGGATCASGVTRRRVAGVSSGILALLVLASTQSQLSSSHRCAALHNDAVGLPVPATVTAVAQFSLLDQHV